VNMMAKAALSSYESLGFKDSVEFCEPHQLVGMLFDALIDSLADSKRFLTEMDLCAKGRSLSRCQKILYGLRSTLDFNAGGELARSLDALYEYCLRRLSSANAENNEAALAEVASLMSEIREAWQLMPTREMPGKQ